jgi:hypothetical protein
MCLQSAPGEHAYSARATVIFVWPGAVPVSRTLDPTVPVLVNYAAMVRLALASDDASAIDSVAFGGSLVGAGVRRGSAVILPNGGGQWSRSYSQPELKVEAVDSTPQAAENAARALVRQISETSTELQLRLNVPSESRVTIDDSSENVTITDGGASSATTVPGLLALAFLGTFLSALAAVTADRIMLHSALPRHLRAYFAQSLNIERKAENL